jgi:hypothetical protein
MKYTFKIWAIVIDLFVLTSYSQNISLSWRQCTLIWYNFIYRAFQTSLCQAAASYRSEGESETVTASTGAGLLPLWSPAALAGTKMFETLCIFGSFCWELYEDNPVSFLLREWCGTALLSVESQCVKTRLRYWCEMAASLRPIQLIKSCKCGRDEKF